MGVETRTLFVGVLGEEHSDVGVHHNELEDDIGRVEGDPGSGLVVVVFDIDVVLHFVVDLVLPVLFGLIDLQRN